MSWIEPGERLPREDPGEVTEMSSDDNDDELRDLSWIKGEWRMER